MYRSKGLSSYNKQGCSSTVWFSESSNFCFNKIYLVFKNWQQQWDGVKLWELEAMGIMGGFMKGGALNKI